MPSALFTSIAFRLAAYALQMLKVESFRLFMDTQLMFVAILRKLWLGRTINFRQALSIFLLVVGAMFFRFNDQPDADGASHWRYRYDVDGVPHSYLDDDVSKIDTVDSALYPGIAMTLLCCFLQSVNMVYIEWYSQRENKLGIIGQQAHFGMYFTIITLCTEYLLNPLGISSFGILWADKSAIACGFFVGLFSFTLYGVTLQLNSMMASMCILVTSILFVCLQAVIIGSPISSAQILAAIVIFISTFHYSLNDTECH